VIWANGDAEETLPIAAEFGRKFRDTLDLNLCNAFPKSQKKTQASVLGCPINTTKLASESCGEFFTFFIMLCVCHTLRPLGCSELNTVKMFPFSAPISQELPTIWRFCRAQFALRFLGSSELWAISSSSW